MWLKDLEKKSPMLMNSIYLLAVLALVLLAVKVAFTYLLPFVIAFMMASAMEPLVRLLVRRKLPRSAAVLLAMLLYFGVALALGFFAVTRLVAEVSDLSKNIPDLGRTLAAWFNELSVWGKKVFLKLPREAVEPLRDSLQTLAGRFTQVLTSLAGSVIGLLTALPNMLMIAMFTIVATFFVSRDRPVFKERLSRQMPAPTFAKVAALKNSLGRSLARFLKAQLFLMALTFSQCFIGLSLIGIPYALVISIFIALVDILPVLGTGTVLIPWGVASLVLGRTATGISLLALYLIVLVVRSVVEPKIVGNQLGLHPLVALMAMFAGLKALGVAGLILGPGIVVIVQAFMKSGLLPQHKE